MKRLRWLPITFFSATLMWYWIRIVLKPQGDFPNHWELGRRMLSGEFIYAGGLDFVYPPFWAFAHLPLALIDVHLAQIMAYALARCLICRLGFSGYRLSNWNFAALAVYALFALILSREIIGQDAVKLLDSYRVKTAAILLLTGTMLSCRRLVTAPLAPGAETRTR